MNKFRLSQLPNELKILVGMFVLVLSIGFFTGINFVHFTTNGTPHGIEENYLGNEDNLEAIEMKFKKTEAQMLNISHTHILSMSIIFFLLSILVYFTSIASYLKKFLMFEALLSVLLTFGGIYLVWLNIAWMKYIVMISGSLMIFSFVLSVLFITKELIKKKPSDNVLNL